MASRCEIELEPINGATVLEVPGGLPVKNNHLNIHVGNLMYCQSRDLVVRMNIPD